MERQGDPGSVRARLLLSASVVGGLFLVGEVLDRGYWLSRRLFERGATTDVFELYVAGESTAVGDPYGDKLAPGILVSGQFAGRIGGREIRVITVAARSQSIYPQSVALERRLRSRDRRNPGAVLVYTGHNDAGRDFAPPPFGESLRRSLAARSALLRDLWYLLEKKHSCLRFRTAESWEYHLRRVVETSLRAGVTPILTTAVSNVADIDPALTEDDVAPAEARAILDPGMRLESSGRHAEAIRYYGSAALPQEHFQRYLKYRIARCHQALKHYERAKALYQEVVDSDGPGNFGRATSAQNGRIRALAVEYGVPLADAERIFAGRSPHGILGESLFSDGHHPNVEGYRLLAAAYAAEISKLFQEPIRKPFVDETDFLRRASLSRRDRSAALCASGDWLFGAAARHAYPRQRLAMASQRYRHAYGLDSGNYAAWLGVQFSGLARRSTLLIDKEGLDWLGDRGFFYGRGPLPECDPVVEIFKELDKTVDAADLGRRCRRAWRAGLLSQ